MIMRDDPGIIVLALMGLEAVFFAPMDVAFIRLRREGTQREFLE